MKKVINGLTYNTETSKEIGHYCNGYYCNDFNHYSETLFRTKKGNHFLYGEGNALSKYSEPIGNNGRGGGSDIIPLTVEEAIGWCEQYDQEALFAHFSDFLEEA